MFYKLRQTLITTLYCSLILLLTSNSLQAAKSVAAINSEQLIDTWDIYTNSNVLIDSVQVNLAVAKTLTARFNYQQLSHSNTDSEALQGFLIEDVVVFNLINLGYSTTYIAKINFTNGGGPGYQVITKLADCNTVGLAKSMVKKKNRRRLSADSARCDGGTVNDSIINNIKLVKQGINPTTIPSTATPNSTFTSRQNKVNNRLSGAWLSSGKGRLSKQRIIIKDISANNFGYSFQYRLLNNTTPIRNLAETDFNSGLRVGFLVDENLIFTSSLFSKPDQLFIFKLKKTLGKGREIRTPNGDCIPLANPSSTVRVCTPNESSSRVKEHALRFENRRIKKSNTKLTVSF